MLEPYKVAFFGDEPIDNSEDIMKLLEEHIRRLIDEHWYVELFVGKNGDFYKCVTAVLDKIHKEYKSYNSSLVLYLPCLTTAYLENKNKFDEYYADIRICSFDPDADMKSVSKICDFKMADDADLIICCVEQKNTSACQAVQYAILQEKPIVNLKTNDGSLSWFFN